MEEEIQNSVKGIIPPMLPFIIVTPLEKASRLDVSVSRGIMDRRSIWLGIRTRQTP